MLIDQSKRGTQILALSYKSINVVSDTAFLELYICLSLSHARNFLVLVLQKSWWLFESGSFVGFGALCWNRHISFIEDFWIGMRQFIGVKRREKGGRLAEVGIVFVTRLIALFAHVTELAISLWDVLLLLKDHCTIRIVLRRSRRPFIQILVLWFIVNIRATFIILIIICGRDDHILEMMGLLLWCQTVFTCEYLRALLRFFHARWCSISSVVFCATTSVGWCL